MNLGKSTLSADTGTLNAYDLYCMKNAAVDNGALFYYVLKERFALVLFMIFAASTYLGFVIDRGVLLWLGAGAGALFANAALRYGLKGIVLVVVSLLPHFLLYVPAFIGLICWCEKLYGTIYLRKNFHRQKEGRGVTIKHLKLLTHEMGFLFKLSAVTAIFLMGCVLESFINPYFLLSFIKKF